MCSIFQSILHTTPSHTHTENFRDSQSQPTYGDKMFGPNSIIGYALVDFPVPLRRNLALFILKNYRHWNGLCPWSDPEFCTRVFVWLEAFCLWLALSLTYLILFNLLSGTFYGARACIRNLFSRPASKHTMPNEISMPDNSQCQTDSLCQKTFYHQKTGFSSRSNMPTG